MGHLLKDGNEVSDPRLARLLEFDEKSRGYAIRPLLPDRPPRSYTWNFWPDKKRAVLDQGPDGSCVGFAWTHECAIRPLATDYPARFAKEQVYWEAQKIDPWPGGVYPGASPKYEGTSILAGAKVMQRLGIFREYRWAFGIEDLIQAVGYHGPAVIGVNWYYGMYFPDKNGFISVDGNLYGGHAVVVSGVNVSGDYFKIINSWGTGWGGGKGINPGWCKISFADMNTLLRDRGEACLPRVRRSEDFK